MAKDDKKFTPENQASYVRKFFKNNPKETILRKDEHTDYVENSYLKTPQGIICLFEGPGTMNAKGASGTNK